MELAERPVSLMVTVNEPEPLLTTSPVPATPLAFIVPIVKVILGVGDGVLAVLLPPHAAATMAITRKETKRLICNSTSTGFWVPQSDTAKGYRATAATISRTATISSWETVWSIPVYRFTETFAPMRS